MDYDFSLIKIEKSEDSGYAVFPADFIKKHWGPGGLSPMPRVVDDPRIIPLLRENYTEKGAAHLRKEFGHVLVEHLEARTKKAPYNYDLIEVVEVDGHAAIDTEAFFDAYSPKDEDGEGLGLRIPSDVQMRIDALVAEPYSDDGVRQIRKFLGDAFVYTLLAPETKYAIHSMVRSRHNRLARSQLPQPARFKQYVLPDQRRLVRGRPVIITEAELRENIDTLREQHAAHVLEVRTLDGRIVDLGSIRVMPPAPVENHTPNPRLDSVAYDRPTGIPFPRFAGDKVLNQDQVKQVVSGMAGIDGELQVAMDGTVTVVPEGKAAVPPPVEEPEVPFEAEPEEPADEEEEVEDLPPGVPPPPPAPGGVSRKNKKNRR